MLEAWDTRGGREAEEDDDVAEEGESIRMNRLGLSVKSETRRVADMMMSFSG